MLTKTKDAESVLSTKAVLACPSISAWSARKYDRQVTRDLHEAKRMSDDAGRYNKYLVGEKDLESITRINYAARAYHLTATLAWMDTEGQRLLPSAKYLEYCERMNTFKQQHEAAVDAFVPLYPGMIEQAKKRLNGAFNPADYPHPDMIRSKFKFTLGFVPVPATDFRCELKADDIEALEDSMRDRMKSALQQTQSEAMERAVGVLKHLAEKLNAYKPAVKNKKGKTVEGAEGTFRDSIVENIRDLIPVLRSFNFAEDRKFDALCDQMDRELCKHDADTLREDEAVRETVCASAEKILADVEQFMA